jgi:hypothetical protein
MLQIDMAEELKKVYIYSCVLVLIEPFGAVLGAELFLYTPVILHFPNKITMHVSDGVPCEKKS